MHKYPIKLFVDAHSLDHEYQGTYTFLKELYSELLCDQHLDIYFGTANPEHLRTIFPNVKPANVLPYKYVKPGLMRYVIDIPRYIREHNFDYAHFQYIIPKNHPGCKYIVTLHDIIFNDYVGLTSFGYRKSREHLYGRSIKNADIKTTVSAYSRDRIAKYYHIDATNIHVLNNGVNCGETPTLADKQKAAKYISEKYCIQNFMLYVSRVEPRKNHQLLLKTWLRLRLYEQGIALVFIGKTSINVTSLKKMIDGLTLQQREYFHQIDQVDDADLQAFYRACRVFVYPSLAEGFGIPPLEAAVNLAPVLCSSATAMKSFSFFEPYMFDPNNEIEFEQKLMQLLEGPPGDKWLANIAKEIETQYNWQHTADTFYHLLK